MLEGRPLPPSWKPQVSQTLSSSEGSSDFFQCLLQSVTTARSPWSLPSTWVTAVEGHSFPRLASPPHPLQVSCVTIWVPA